MDNEKFLASEHMAGFHDKVTEGCYECHREQRIIKAKCVCNDWNLLFPEGRTQHALDRLDYHFKNPLEE